jgi:Protein of unknown function (DUF3631)/Toprim-like
MTSSGDVFNDAAIAYFASHAIDPKIAAQVGVGFRWGELTYPYGGNDTDPYVRARDLVNGKTIQPKGTKLEPWLPVGATGAFLLVCEGESDCLAAITALYEIIDRSEDGEAIAPELYPRDDLPQPLKGAVPVALPGAGACHDLIVSRAGDRAGGMTIAFDGDPAGRNAAEKLRRNAEEMRIDASVVDLPDGRDLADVLAAADDPITALAELVAEADAGVEEVSVEDDPGPEAEPVEPLPNDAVAGLLERVVETLDRYIVLPGEYERDALVLFVAHSWAIDGAHATPYFLIVSPEKRSGKSRLLQVLELLVACPWSVIGASEAAVFRKIAKHKPTMLLDEIDAIFGSQTERTEPLRAILNAGNRPGATVARCVGENKDVEDFPIYCAKVLAGIDSGHRIPDTIRDRAVTIHMHRKTGAELVERFRHRDADAEAQPIREGLERWALGAVDLLQGADPNLPHELDDRAAEAWEPLLAIADMAGGDWPRRAREAALGLVDDGDRDEVTTGTLLLGAIRAAFGDTDRMPTADLLDAINADEELPFGGWREGRGLDGRRLAKLLKPYGVHPKKLRLGDELARGYLREDLSDAWDRWLPSPCVEAEQAEQAEHDPTGGTQKPLEQADVPDVPHVPARGNGTVPASGADEAEIERIGEKFGGAA